MHVLPRKQPEAAKSELERCDQPISTADNSTGHTGQTSILKVGNDREAKEAAHECWHW